MPSPNVAYQRPELLKHSSKWSMIEDCLEGQDAVKAKKTLYLPKPDPSNCTIENAQRYENYLNRAVFYNVLARTLSGMTGLVFQQDPEIDLPDDMGVIKKSADGAGVSLNQQMRSAFKQVAAFGRAGLLVDYPPNPTGENGEVLGFTRQQMIDGAVQPTINLYKPWQVVNWVEEYINGQVMLKMVVIHDQVPGYSDGFEQDFTPTWRVLSLDENGDCKQQLWVKRGDSDDLEAGVAKPTYIVEKTFYMRDSNGVPLKFIPFKFIGSENNNALPDQPPLYDMAVLNIAHYRNSADYEESCFVTGQPTVWAAGLTDVWVKDVLNGELRLGSYGGIPLPPNAAIGLLQTQPNTQPFEAMKQKEAQMISIGARLISDSGSVERREVEVKNEAASEASLISSVAQNIENAYQEALLWAAMFYGHAEVDIDVNLNYNFIFSQMSYQERAELISEWSAGAITWNELRRNLKQAGIATENDDKAKTEIIAEQAEKQAVIVKNAAELAKITAANTPDNTKLNQDE